MLLRTLLLIIGTVSSLGIARAQSDIDTKIAVNDVKDPNLVVLIIANEHYKEQGFEVEDVPFAVRDGAVFEAYCKKTLGVKDDNINFIYDATGGKIRAALNKLSSRLNAYAGSARAIIYYSGHGMPDEATKDAYLLPVDGLPADPESAIKTSWIYKRLESMNTKSITVFLDACFSGASREGNTLSKGARGVAIKTKESPVGDNTVVFSAAQGTETAYPYQEKQHGLFTYYILEKLQQSKGNVTLGELSDYVTQQVRLKSSGNGMKDQTPIVAAAESNKGWRNWKMASTPATKYVNTTVAIPSGGGSAPASDKPSRPVATASASTAASKALPSKAGVYELLPGIYYEMIRIDKGTFLMGSKITNGHSSFYMNQPIHEVALGAYTIGKTEVSQELWQAVMGNNPSEHKNPKNPVENVSWEDCQEFISKLNEKCGTRFRLPTEAEWEYAADARVSSNCDTYSGKTHLRNIAHRGSSTAPCGTYEASAVGLQDMTGNVAEWCEDYLGLYSPARQVDPRGPSKGYQRVVKGGSYKDDPEMMRNSFRGHMRAYDKAPTVGLRLVHDAK